MRKTVILELAMIQMFRVFYFHASLPKCKTRPHFFRRRLSLAADHDHSAAESRASKSLAALMSAVCASPNGKFPRCSPHGPSSSA